MSIKVNGVTTLIKLNAGEDLSSATVKRIYYRKPSGTQSFWAASLDATNQILQYSTTATTDLDEDGEWVLDGYIESPTWNGYSTSIKMQVNAVNQI
jgi:hypothetical protein